MFAGINMFWARLRLILARAARRGLKWVWVENLWEYILLITLWRALRKWKLKKMTTKHSEECFFHQRCEKTSTYFEMASRFWLAAKIVRLFDSHFLLVYFSGLKYILARQILHFSPQNAPHLPDKVIIILLSSWSDLHWCLLGVSDPALCCGLFFCWGSTTTGVFMYQ